MRNRVHELYKEVCVPKPKSCFFVVDQEKETVEQVCETVLRETKAEDIVVFFVT